MNNFIANMIEGIFNKLSTTGTEAILEDTQPDTIIEEVEPAITVDVVENDEYTQEDNTDDIMTPPILLNDESSYVVNIEEDTEPVKELQEVKTTKVSKHWYNNGEEQILAVTCPDGWVSGKLKK